MAATKENILAALEQACRENVLAYERIMTHCQSDLHASGYGGLTPRIAFITGAAPGQVRRVLHAEVLAGRVLLHKPYPRTIAWWPVGLWEKLQAEQQAACVPDHAHARAS